MERLLQGRFIEHKFYDKTMRQLKRKKQYCDPDDVDPNFIVETWKDKKGGGGRRAITILSNQNM